MGNKGSALYLKGISVTITDSTFTQNGAVDAYRESQLVPAYTEHIGGLDASLLPNRLFTYD